MGLDRVDVGVRKANKANETKSMDRRFSENLTKQVALGILGMGLVLEESKARGVVESAAPGSQPQALPPPYPRV